MSVFGFIENFFFISLALVFVLVIFLVYHFKNRITVAEKKSESMYGLLTAVVKEIKTLRGMFGLGGTVEPEQLPEKVEIKSQTKTTPEVNVLVGSDSDEFQNTFSKYISNKSSSSSLNVGVRVGDDLPRVFDVASSNGNKDVITFEITPCEKKIVVSDEESEEEYSEDDESTVSEDTYESESDQESESDSEQENTHQDNIDLGVEEVLLEIETDPASQDIHQIDSPTKQCAAPSSVSLQFCLQNHPITTRILHSGIVQSSIETFPEKGTSVENGGFSGETLEEFHMGDGDEQIVVESNREEEPTLEINSSEPDATSHFENIHQPTPVSDINNEESEKSENSIDLSSSATTLQIPSLEQLRKMNINQLKNIASQFGITVDVSKMKKPELITLIREK